MEINAQRRICVESVYLDIQSELSAKTWLAASRITAKLSEHVWKSIGQMRFSDQHGCPQGFCLHNSEEWGDER